MTDSRVAVRLHRLGELEPTREVGADEVDQEIAETAGDIGQMRGRQAVGVSCEDSVGEDVAHRGGQCENGVVIPVSVAAEPPLMCGQDGLFTKEFDELFFRIE